MAAGVAFILYRPDTNAPFEIIDFSETLPFLTDGQNFGERFRGLVGYYLQHGRAALALSAGLAAKWTLFEWWTPGWQWTRFCIGLSVVVLTWHFLRALGANRAGASVGASLFVVSETAAPGWLRPSVNEPFGTMILLVASLLACRYQGTTRPARLAALIALCLALMMVVKETLIAASFFPLAIALCRRPDGLLAGPERSSRNLQLLGFAGLAIAIASIPVIWALTKAAPEGYARQFGASASMFSNAAFGVIAALVPFTPISQSQGWIIAIADVAWIVLILIGLNGWRTDAATRRHFWIVIVLALALPLTRAIVYMPWPIQFPYYAIPYLLGIVILTAMSVTGVSRGTWLLRSIAAGTAMIVLFYAAAGSFTIASRYFAVRRLTDDLVTKLHDTARNEDAQALIVAVPRLTIQDWWGLAPTLERFARATSRHLPAGRDLLCDDAKDLLTHPPDTRTVIAAIRWQCSLGSTVRTVQSVATRVGRPNLRPVNDTLFADYVVLPRSRER